ncbi:MAG: hypothetical protein HY840_07060 [Bacteroidetes bacterium]|nr:hypothetical protein [Bacteroidota bacterium]
MKLFFIALFSFVSLALFAQDDLLQMLDSITPKDKSINKVTGTFKTTKIVSLQTIATMGKGDLDFRITHRFGNIGGASNGGVHTLYGWDAISDVRFSFDYGITNKLQIGIARNKMMENLDGSIKWRLLEQTIDNRVPLSIAAFGIASLTPIREAQLFSGASSSWIANASADQVLQDRITYTSQIIFARKFGNRLSFEIAPTYTHRNYVLSRVNGNNYAADETNIFSIGTGLRLKLTRSFSLLADYFYVMSAFRKDNPDQPYYTPLSVGIEIETGGHVFHVNVTNASGIIENYFIPNTTDSWLKGGYKLGFNISRVFTIGKSTKSAEAPSK